MLNSHSRVLIVDDDPAVAEFAATVAADKGFETCVLDDSARIFETVECFAPAVILLDLIMPNLDGVQILKRLGEEGCRAAVVLLSGADPRALSAAAHLGETRGLNIRAMLKKPIEIDELETALGAVPGRRVDISERDLRAAIAAGEITAAYQPKVRFGSTSTWHIAGFEALARWQHPTFGAIPPSQFIGLAEETGLIEALTFTVVEQALNQAAQLNQRGFKLDVAVNLSGHLLSLPLLPDQLGERVKAAGLDVGRLVLELTETVAMTDPVTAMENMTRFRLKGFKLSLDDYGTGHSSLNRLYRMPFSELKIDRSFVEELGDNNDSRVIVKSLVDLAHNLGLSACAEGVETKEAWQFLDSVGCDLAQGHLIAAAMPGTDLTKFVERNAADNANAVTMLIERTKERVSERADGKMVMQSILIVDDDPAVRECLKRIVSDAGYQVSLARDGREACKQLDHHHFDAVICDIFMPEMDGIETIIDIKRRQQRIWVIALSGGGQRRNLNFLAASERIGADGTITKPFEPEAVIDALRSMPAPVAPRKSAFF